MRYLALIALLTFVLVGCKSRGAQSKSPAVATAEHAERAAMAALLTIQDLPEGWVRLPADDDEEAKAAWETLLDEEFVPQFEACGISREEFLNDQEVPFEGELGTADSPEYESADESQSLEMTVSFFESADAATGAVMKYAAEWQACRAAMTEYFRRYGEAAAANDPELASAGFSMQLEDLPAGPNGEQRFGFRIVSNAPGVDLIIVSDSIIIQRGRFAGMVSLTSMAGPPQVEGFLGQFTARMESTAALFP